MSDETTTPEPPPTLGTEDRLTAQQIKQLLTPVNPRRVKQDFNGNSHLPYFDVTAHLNRVLGFGNFDTELKECVLIDSRSYDHTPKKGAPYLAWDALYRAIVKLTVKAPNGTVIATYENGSTGDATAQRSIADAHDLAMKSAISLATKRCAINLGDQFGLSLYNKGQMQALVINSFVNPNNEGVRDVQRGVPESRSMGVDETKHGDQEIDMDADQQAAAAKTLGHTPIPKTVPKVATA